jgi:hypothetical protein
MFIRQTKPGGKLGKAKHVDLVRVGHGSIGVSTEKGASVTLISDDEIHHVTINAFEFALMRAWFEKYGCEE